MIQWNIRLLGLGLVAFLGCLLASQPVPAAPIVDEGQPRAQIIVAEQAPRMARLAARELQTYVRKMTGATLPITDTPSEDPADVHRVRIYIGQSKYTDRLGVSAEGLAYGAFHIIAGDEWLVLLGQDDDFEPVGPWSPQRSARHADYARMLQEWDEISGGRWRNPVSIDRALSMNRELIPGEVTWAYDKRGSLNAVYEFLRRQGVRWYMPGDLGEVVPQRQSIALPQVDETIRPDFALRQMNYAHFARAPLADVLWYLRLGLNHGDEMSAPPLGHGLREITRRAENREAHPEYYALYNGERDEDRQCLSSEGLFAETVAYARAMFDVYDMLAVSVMPSDGFRMCECELCEGKASPHRPREGQLSNYVWSYVNRVAEEVYKTHPDKRIICFAYGTYALPPEHIEKLSPNVQVGIVHARNPAQYGNPAHRERVLELRAQWLEKTSNELLGWEHYVFSHRGFRGPLYFPRAIADSLRSFSEVAEGEFLEVSSPVRGEGWTLHAPIFNHLNLYVTARLHWDANRDIDALLEEYYDLFYGPAAEPMQQFIAYCEANLDALRRDPDNVARSMELLEAAHAAVDPETVYGERVQALVEYMQPMHERHAQLSRGRPDDIPEARAVERSGGALTLDGRIDEGFWQDVPVHQLRDVVSGDEPRTATSFQVAWVDGAICFAIRCEEPDMANLNIGTDIDGDVRLWEGDNVEILLETQSHAYYQIAIAPSGAVADIDRQDRNYGWSSQAQAATHQDDDHWAVEVRVPVFEADAPQDPLHEVVGRKPETERPWYFNVCRTRLRDGDREASAFSPTGEMSFHDVMRFARLIVQ